MDGVFDFEQSKDNLRDNALKYPRDEILPVALAT